MGVFQGEGPIWGTIPFVLSYAEGTWEYAKVGV